MTKPNDLVAKYLKDINARRLADGSPHPDDLSEAQFLAAEELLKSGQLEAPEDCPPFSDKEAFKAWVTTANLFGNSESFYEAAVHSLEKHYKQVSNAPINRGRLPHADDLKNELDALVATGIKRPQAIKKLAVDYSVAKNTVYTKLRRGGHKLKT